MDYIVILDILGIIAFSFTGYILAVRAELDIMGVFIISSISALGGGLIRDIIVDRTPFIFTNIYPLSVVLVTIIVSIILKLHKKNNLTNNYIFIVADSIGLSLFAITGAGIGLAAGINLPGVIFLGLLTAIGGGIIRDMILNVVPTILTNEVYGSIAIIIAFIMWVVTIITPITPIITALLLIFGTLLRLFVIKKNYHLPKIH